MVESGSGFCVGSACVEYAKRKDTVTCETVDNKEI